MANIWPPDLMPLLRPKCSLITEQLAPKATQMSLDVATITVAGGIAAWASGLLLLMYWWHDRTAWSAFWWAASLCAGGFGIVLLTLHALLPVSSILGPLILDLSAALAWCAARIFNR